MINRSCRHCGVKFANKMRWKSKEWEISPWITGSTNHRTSNIMDRTKSEQHVASMALMCTACTKANKELIKSYAPIARYLMTVGREKSEWGTCLKFVMFLLENMWPSTNTQRFTAWLNHKECDWVPLTKEIVPSILPTTLLKFKKAFLQSLSQMNFFLQYYHCGWSLESLASWLEL